MRLSVSFGLRKRLEEDAINDGFDGVVLALLKAHALFHFRHLAVDTYPIAFFIKSFQLFPELTLSTSDDWCEHGDALTGGVGTVALHNLRDDLVG